MRSETLYVLKKEIEKKCKINPLKEGTYNVDETITLEVLGEVKKLADIDITPTVDIPLKAALILCLDKLEFFKRANFKATLLNCMKEALSLKESGNEHILEKVEDLEKMKTHLEGILDKLPKKTRAGATLVNGTMTEISIKKTKVSKRKVNAK